METPIAEMAGNKVSMLNATIDINAAIKATNSKLGLWCRFCIWQKYSYPLEYGIFTPDSFVSL